MSKVKRAKHIKTVIHWECKCGYEQKDESPEITTSGGEHYCHPDNYCYCPRPETTIIVRCLDPNCKKIAEFIF